MSALLSCALPSEYDPRQWSNRKRWTIALVIWNLIAPIDLAITFYSGVQGQIQEEFGTSNALATLGVGLYNLGGVFGVLFGGPLSELYGRRPIYIVCSICFAVFSLGSTLSPNVSTLLICRGLMGLLGSPVFSIYGGSVADLFTPEERGPVVALFTLVLQGAPTIGPVPSSFLGPIFPWRWLFGFITIWGGVLAVAVTLFVPETEPATIRRKLVKSEGIVVDVEEQVSLQFIYPYQVLIYFSFYPAMLRSEPIMIWTTLYHSFVYGLLFILLEVRMLLAVISGFNYLSFLGIPPYLLCSLFDVSRASRPGLHSPHSLETSSAFSYTLDILKPQYEARQRMIQIESGGKSEIEPEARLPGTLHYFFPTISGVPIGMGMTLLQLSLFNYYIDLYPTMSASAIAANSTIRGVAATVFPSVGLPLYSSLGIRNANVLLACISCIGLPTGVILYVFGRRLRAASKWAQQATDSGLLPRGSVEAAAPLLARPPQNHYGGTSSSD
ncbi:major facilitator superfamily domain-containing protein [Pisolithus marmoratus]|nr:major facilitator superfamily domain-containing protein [Pisolithus marmoratus]